MPPLDLFHSPGVRYRRHPASELYERGHTDSHRDGDNGHERYDNLFDGLAQDSPQRSGRDRPDDVIRRREQHKPGAHRARVYEYDDRDFRSPRYREETEFRPNSYEAAFIGGANMHSDMYDREANSRKPEDRSVHKNAVVCNVSRTTDPTLHLELEATDDIEAELEEFSKLGRLGNFAAAKKCLTTSFTSYEKNPYVLVQLAQMMLDSGNFGALNDLEEMDVPYHNALQHNWDLLKYAGLMRIDGDLLAHDNFGVAKRYIPREGDYTSTKIQPLVIALRNEAYVSRFNAVIDHAHVQFAFSLMRYRHLLTEGRIWDFKDIFTCLVLLDYDMGLLPSLFGTKDVVHLFDKLVADWSTGTGDEPTIIALIDIATTIFFARRRSREEARHLVDKATSIISPLLHHNPNIAVTRQYIRWILAKVSIEVYADDELLGFIPPAGSPGIFLSQDHALRPPVYVPFGSETPTFLASRPRPELASLIHTALDGARSLEDYETEALCLQALIYRTEAPASIYDELAQLQENTQSDFQGCLQTYLSRYVFCHNDKSRAKLREDILSLGECENFPPTLAWARAMILRALSTSKTEAAACLQLAMNKVLGRDIHPKYRDFMVHVELKQEDRLDTIQLEHVKRRNHKPSIHARTRRSGATQKRGSRLESRDRTRPMLAIMPSGEAHDTAQNEDYDEAQDEVYDEEHDEAHSRSQGEYHDRAREHISIQDEIHDEGQGKGQDNK